MKKNIYIFVLLCSLLVCLTSQTACSRKTGCPMNEKETVGAKTTKKGLSTKPGKSNLFPKDMRRN